MKEKIIIVFLFFVLTKCHAQNLEERISWKIYNGPQVKSNGEGTVAWTFGAEVNLRLASFVEGSLQYENGIFDFGTEHLHSFNSTEYQTKEGAIKSLRRLGLNIKFNLSSAGIPVVFGTGFHYDYQPGIIYNHYMGSGSYTKTDISNPVSRISRLILVGVKKDKWEMGLRIYAGNDKNFGTHNLIYFGRDIISARPNRFEKFRTRKKLHELLIEVGGSWHIPLNNKYAGVSNAFLSPKVAFGDDITFGLYFETRNHEYGHDEDFKPLIVSNQFGERQNTFFHDRMARLTNASVFVDKYFFKNGECIFFGGGFSYYKIKEIDEKEGIDIAGNSIRIDGKAKGETFGILGRVGMKIGWLRPSVNFNIGMKDVPVHLSFQLGIEPGFFRRK